jgi:hypothetical protein
VKVLAAAVVIVRQQPPLPVHHQTVINMKAFKRIDGRLWKRLMSHV